MEEIQKALGSPAWWVLTIIFGLMVSVLANFITRRLDAFFAKWSKAWRENSEKRNDAFMQKAWELAKDDEANACGVGKGSASPAQSIDASPVLGSHHDCPHRFPAPIRLNGFMGMAHLGVIRKHCRYCLHDQRGQLSCSWQRHGHAECG